MRQVPGAFCADPAGGGGSAGAAPISARKRDTAAWSRLRVAGLDFVVLVAVERAGPTAVDALLSHQDNRGRLRDL
jgi:hypothetical protein